MLWTKLRCQTLRPPFTWSHKTLFQPARQFSQTSFRPFLRQSRCLRQEISTNASLKENVSPPAHDGPSFYEKISKPGIWRQVTFVSVTSFLAFSLAATQTTLETEYWTERMVAVSSVWTLKTITNTDLKRAQTAELIQGLRESLANIQSVVQQLPVLIRPWVNLACLSVMQPYADATEGKRLCWKICLLNAGVWLAWKLKPWKGFMTVRFMHYPLSGLSYTLLTSMFSHRSAIHLLCNCLALESFGKDSSEYFGSESSLMSLPGSAAYHYLLREQNKAQPDVLESTTSYHFLAFFISAGLFSGLVSHIVNAKFRYPRLVSQLASSANSARRTETWAGAVAATTASAAQSTSKKRVLDILPSLGASGAIYAAVTMTALAFPDSEVALFIPPSYPINIQYGVGALMALDMIGILRGWRLFDHWAHLGGAAFGIFYYNYGPSYWAYLRKATAKVDKST
ncbi:hypothetical protein M413DRAFT_67386 [Hebeloma cylindrosporum]|uniref:Peptidase S54 rhomboid domain-containing protein n=1 Tax=Hebeloma cylindrosporum TaxID=76867 RepID=A0A0C3CL25_HEBCY|nr:hypothetical protein M413DRAFT_67386 [Hebeloma cylindrosporum h7]